jgi:PhoH-like ATPase
MTKKKQSKIFVLDTSVILHDHNAINCFDEHDVAIPITVMEEIDTFKKGNDTKNFAAREFIRTLDILSKDKTIQDWNPINGDNTGRFKLVMFNAELEVDAIKVFGKTNDNKILNAALTLRAQEPDRSIILVSKDINLRLKAKSLGMHAEDYTTGKVDKESAGYTGKIVLENVDIEVINKLYKEGVLEDTSFLPDPPINNGFYILKNGKTSILSFFDGVSQVLERVEKEYIYGIKPKNAEQTLAIRALLDPNIKLVTLQGVAGTGKTLLALASAIEQHNSYNQIVLARPIVPLSNNDIGFLPGNAEDKINPYMQPLFDNLKFIKNQFGPNEKKHKKIDEMEETDKLSITALAFIRGRSFSNMIFIVDEAQNLTPHEVKTIITRAGENTKIIFTGDIFQIDTPYLDDQSNGMSYIIDRLKGNNLFAHITLEKGERSELANLANEML